MSSFEGIMHLVTFRPLQEPIHCDHKVSPFDAPWYSTVETLERELRMHGAVRAVMEIDFRESDLRLDGVPRANCRPGSPGVVLSFEATRVPGRPKLRYEIASFSRFEDNVRAIALGLEALRKVDRYGISQRGEQYAGWRALPSGRGDPSPDRGRKLIQDYGTVAAALKATHPDHGGNSSDFADVQAARQARTA